MTNQARIGVLGLGSIGLRHADNLIGLGADTVGFDPNPDRREMLAAAGGAVVESREALFDNVSALVVATPNALHMGDCRDAIERDLHVFVEKPVAHTERGFDDILKAADRNERVLFVGQNLRYHPAVKVARDWLSSGRLGTLLWARLICSSYLPDWRPHSDYRQGYAADPFTGGVLFDAIHEFDMASYLLGPGVVSACEARTTELLEISSDDCADVLMQHPGGVVSTIHVDYVTRPKYRVTEVAGSEGGVRLDVSNRSVTITRPDGTIAEKRQWNDTVAADYREEMRHFLECIAGNARPACDGNEAIRILREVVKARALAGLPKTAW